jgi:acetylornithine deacetylase/succinyl-diaminopimelate desuccinylase-like protein
VDCGVRGILLAELSVRTLTKDVHSSAATLFPSAAARMAAALSTLVSADGEPTWAGLQTGRLPLTDAARDSARAQPLEWLDDYRNEFGITRFIGGLDGADALEADVANPTINIQGLWSGETGPVARNVVPAEATARLDIRLVPDQDPDVIQAALREHLDAHGFEDVELKPIDASERPYWSDLTDPFVDAAAGAVEAAFGRPRSGSRPSRAPRRCTRCAPPTRSRWPSSAPRTCIATPTPRTSHSTWRSADAPHWPSFVFSTTSRASPAA